MDISELKVDLYDKFGVTTSSRKRGDKQYITCNAEMAQNLFFRDVIPVIRESYPDAYVTSGGATHETCTITMRLL